MEDSPNLAGSKRTERARSLSDKTEEAQRAHSQAAASANTALAALRSTEAALAELGRYNPKLAATLSATNSAERQAAEKEFADRTAKLRAERDDALGRLQVSEKTNHSLRTENDRLKSAQSGTETVAQQSTVTVPDVLRQ